MYISEAKKYQPTIGKNLHEYIVQKYLEKRKDNSEKVGYVYTTPRTLLGIIRLSQALVEILRN